MSKLVYLQNYETYTDDRDDFRVGQLELHLSPEHSEYLTEVVSDGCLFGDYTQIVELLSDKSDVLTFVAQSGLSKFQDIGHIWTRGRGAIPPSSSINGDYRINLLPTFSNKSKSLFYLINPLNIYSNDLPGKMRSEIGLHLDRGVRGSSGCVVLPQFDEFVTLATIFNLLVMKEEPIFTLPFEVISSTDFV